MAYQHRAHASAPWEVYGPAFSTVISDAVAYAEDEDEDGGMVKVPGLCAYLFNDVRGVGWGINNKPLTVADQ